MTKYESRATRLSKVLDNIDTSSIEDAIGEIEALKDELQNWLDNLPENLQSSNKADELQTAIDELETVGDELQGAVDTIEEQSQAVVEFPGMY